MSDESDCTACPLQDRRAFLRGTALAAVAVAGLPALARALETGALRVSAIPASAVRGAARSYPIPAADGVQIDHDADLIVVRWEGAIYAFDLSCPHQNTALRWDEGSGHFRCPKHHSVYQPDGTYVSGRATRGMDRFAISRGGTSIEIDTDRSFRQDREPEAWNAAVIRLQGTA
jgi:Rieske Fe-S protein